MAKTAQRATMLKKLLFFFFLVSHLGLAMDTKDMPVELEHMRIKEAGTSMWWGFPIGKNKSNASIFTIGDIKKELHKWQGIAVYRQKFSLLDGDWSIKTLPVILNDEDDVVTLIKTYKTRSILLTLQKESYETKSN